jgi:uncharacterized protein YneF (UPF0154 family)
MMELIGTIFVFVLTACFIAIGIYIAVKRIVKIVKRNSKTSGQEIEQIKKARLKQWESLNDSIKKIKVTSDNSRSTLQN